MPELKEYILKGFFYPTAEIYGGLSGFYDYAYLGTLLKQKWSDLWRKHFLSLHPNFWEVEPALIMPKAVFIGSGHLENFNDPIVECENGHRFRADHLVEEKLGIKAEGLTLTELNKLIQEKIKYCPECGAKLKEVRWFNLMLPVYIGPSSQEAINAIKMLRNLLPLESALSLDQKEIKDEKELKSILSYILNHLDEFEIDAREEENTIYIYSKKGDFALVIKGEKDNAVFEAYGNIKKDKPIDKDIWGLIEEILDKVEEDYLSKDFERYYKLRENLLEIFKRLVKMEKNEAYLRPETAQGPYLMFKREFILHRNRLPLGLAVIGKAFRNEISPRQLLIRQREFNQAELQIFFDPVEWGNNFDKYFDINEVLDKELNFLPANSDKVIRVKIKDLKEKFPDFYLYFLGKIKEFYEKLGIPEDKLRFRELSEEEKAFYNKYHIDIEINFPTFGWKEVGGLHYRTDHDLSGHQKVSGENLEVFVNNRKFIPHVLELSFGLDRNLLAIIDLFLSEEGYEVERGGKRVKEKRVVLKIPRKLAPIEIAVFPLLSNKEELKKKAREVYTMLKEKGFSVVYDEKDSIGRRYRRVDEIGVPFAITIDYQTLEDDTVTVRDRDTMKQERVKIEDLVNYFREKFD